MTEKSPARLHALLAREASYGVVIRRGPAKQTCFIGWDRRTDTFEPAQWLKGRIYERRSDLSPDGRYIIYFAMNGKWNSETKGAWTAISQSPWLKAKTLWAKGDCWHGGGLFIDNRSYWLNDGSGHALLKQTSEVVRDMAYQPQAYYGGECPGVYFIRLQRDGWIFKDYETMNRSGQRAIFEKPLPKGWILRKIAHAQVNPPPGKGCYWDEHFLIRGDQEIQHCPDWEWAEWDRQRIVWVAQGCLYACSIRSRTGLHSPKSLYDFNDMTFQPVTAPY